MGGHPIKYVRLRRPGPLRTLGALMAAVSDEETDPQPVLTSVVHEPSGLVSFESARVSWRLESLGGRRCCVGAIVVCRAQLNTIQKKIFTGVVDTWRVGINQQYLYSSGEYLTFAWLFQRKKVACRGILTAQDSSPLDSARVQVWTRLEPAREQHYLLSRTFSFSPATCNCSLLLQYICLLYR